MPAFLAIALIKSLLVTVWPSSFTIDDSKTFILYHVNFFCQGKFFFVPSSSPGKGGTISCLGLGVIARATTPGLRKKNYQADSAFFS
jgi:hypothetical protein